MKCPKCQSDKVAVIETTQHEEYTYRRRHCKNCFINFKTREVVYDGIIPKITKKLTDPTEKEIQKAFKTSQLQTLWR